MWWIIIAICFSFIIGTVFGFLFCAIFVGFDESDIDEGIKD